MECTRLWLENGADLQRGTVNQPEWHALSFALEGIARHILEAVNLAILVKDRSLPGCLKVEAGVGEMP